MMVSSFAPGDHVRRSGPRARPILREVEKKLSEPLVEVGLAQSVAERGDDEGRGSLVSASLHTLSSSRRTRTRPDNSRISSSTDRVRGSIDKRGLRGSRRGRGGFMGVLVCMVEGHEHEGRTAIDRC
jgi:hypothetical protein